MNSYIKKIGMGVAVLLVGMAVVLGIYLYQSNQRAISFTNELNALSQMEPEIIIEGDAVSSEQAGQSLEVIQRLYDQKNQAWCDGDAVAFAAVYAANADYISFDGTYTVGRENIQSSHQELFENFVEGTCLVGEITKIRFLNEDAAVFYAMGGTVFDNDGIARRPSIQTFTVVREDGRWQFTSFHNGRIDRIDDWNVLRLMWLGLQTFALRR